LTGADEGALTADFVLWAARRVVAQHETPPPATMTPEAAVPRCAQCGERRCPLLDWARGLIG
jgi:hypothetical protein